LGRNAVISKTNIDAAINQWKARETRECLGTRSGIDASTSGESFAANFLGLASALT
jgi:hypothetical protein